MTSLAWAWLLGVLDGVERGSDVEVLGLKKLSQPAALVGEAHGQHGRQGLHQTGVRLWEQGEEVNEGAEPTHTSFVSNCAHLEASVGKEPPPADLWSSAALLVGGPGSGSGPDPPASATAAHL